MTADEAALAPATTRLGQLQRGRGAGYLAALRDGAAAHDDLLHCVLVDPRIDRQIEARDRYYGELVVAVDLPLEPVLAHLAGEAVAGLAHAVLAAAWRLGHPLLRALLAAPDSDEALVAGITEHLWGMGWATRVELPPRAAAIWLRLSLADADSVRAAVRPPLPTALGALSLPALLELGRDARFARQDRLLGELCARGDEATRSFLLSVVADDVVFPRVRLAARALGLLDDERLLPLAEEHFAREDVFADPRRRLPGLDRMRRACLADYVQHLPGPRALALARAWRGRGGYFETVVGRVFQEHATAADRADLEAFVAAHRSRSGGFDVIDELDALGRLADPQSAPLLVAVAREAAYSHARRRAVHALAAMPEVELAQDVLREALWDAEDEAAADGCTFLPELDAAARARVAVLADLPLGAAELRERALRRLRRS